MLKPSRILSAVCFAAMTVAVSSAQTVTSAHSGTLHYFQGDVAIDGTLVHQEKARFAEVKENSVLSTTQGRAEVLLTPGVFLRVGENSSIKMLDNRLISTRVELLSGTAIVESDDPQMDVKNSPVTLLYKDYEIHLLKQGLFEIGADNAQMKVYKGEATVAITSGNTADRATVKEGHQLTFSVALLTEKFNDKVGDDLYLWTRDRSQAISAANMSSARTLNPNGGGFGGWLGSGYVIDPGYSSWNTGWYFNPWLNMYTFVPGTGAYWNAFGYGFFSPGSIYAFYSPSMYWYGGAGARGAGFSGWSLGTVHTGSGAAPLSHIQPRSNTGFGGTGPARAFGAARNTGSLGSFESFGNNAGRNTGMAGVPTGSPVGSSAGFGGGGAISGGGGAAPASAAAAGHGGGHR